MRRYLTLVLAFAFASLAMPGLAQGPLPCSVPGGGLTVRGRLLDPAVVPQDGVACCLVEVMLRVGQPLDTHVVRTRADGTFATCFDCSHIGQPIDIVITSRCCSFGPQLVARAPGCFDPLTGMGITVDVGDITCADLPITNSTAVQGSVVCRSGALLEPVADCAILVEVAGAAVERDLVRTDVNGDYETCVDCLPVAVGTVTAQCCGEQVPFDIPSCPGPERVQVPTMICDPCPVPPCNIPTDIEIRGQLICDLDGDGVVDPVAGCDVALTFVSQCAGGVVPSVTVATNPNGVFSACVPCPAGEDCGEWTLVAQPACCADTFTARVFGCPPVLDLGSLSCCPSGGGCPPGQTVVRGRVTCVDPALPTPQPVVGCVVDLTPQGCGGRLVRAVTDANGDYSACVDCAGCAEVLVSASCCNVSQMAPLSCTSETVVDLSCGTCQAPPCPGQQEVHGRLTCLDAAGVAQPIPGCLVSVGCVGEFVFPTTDANGYYVACLPCDACPEIMISPRCCGGSILVTPTPNCTPLAADMNCGDCVAPQPCPGQQEVNGRVTCLDPGGLPRPVAGCDVRVECTNDPSISATVTTDVNGDYAACLPCGACTVVRATALCCNASTLVQLSPTCPPVTADISCGSCVPLPNPCSPEQTIVGRVTCDSNGDGTPDPLPDCAVRVECLGVPGFDTIVTTDGNGEYVACIPCTTCTTARATALCCGQSAIVTLTPPNCVPVRADIACLNCPPPSPCGPSEQAIFGRVTCLDAGAQRQPMADCFVRVDCFLASVTVMTDANGDYVACLPCGVCDFATVTPVCCQNGAVTVQLNPAVCLPIRQDVDCGACVPPRPCPGPPLSTLVSGALVCAQGGVQAPLANAVVILEALDASGNPLPAVATALTDGAGQYRACLPCPNGMAFIRATSQGCDVSSQAPAIGCPETLSLGVMLCTTCSPCPAGSTRLQGQIHCRGGGPVANCAIRVVVNTCNQVLVFDAQADANGKYRLCIPCPCNDSDIRVTALCCNASRSFHVDRCGPITPVPTLYCPSPCR